VLDRMQAIPIALAEDESAQLDPVEQVMGCYLDIFCVLETQLN
jgi:hypothetical protein